MMTDRQLYSKDWLNRMYRVAMHIESLESKREQVISSLSGIGHYDAEFVPTQTGENSVETKHLTYSYYSDLIEKEQKKLASEDIRTSKIIEMLGNTPEDDTMKTILNYRYLSRFTWEAISQKTNFSLSWIYELHKKSLAKIYPLIPKEPIYED